jgi:putative copper export protein/mono/diheme cytochrome c family protein
MELIDTLQAILRGLHVVSLVLLFGVLVFLSVVAPRALVEAEAAGAPVRLRLVRIARDSAALALVSGLGWLAIQTAVIAGTDNIGMTLHALPLIALHTQFGKFLLLRFALLVMVLPLVGRRRTGFAIAIVLAGAALAVQAAIGHAGAIGGRVGAALVGSEALHLLAAGAWLGGLLPLLVVVGLLPQRAAVTACRGFSAVGLPAVLVLAVTALAQGSHLVGGLPGLLGTGYGRVAVLKLVLFPILVMLAALNRFALTARLADARSQTRGQMRLSIATEATLGALVVIAAGFLASQTPGAHEQPVWPFPLRPSLDVLSDPQVGREVVTALVAVGGAIVVASISLVWRRWHWPLLAIATVVLALAIPHLQLLFIAAYPTSFFTSPTEFAVSAITHGARLFQTNCAVCHGATGKGDGPAAKTLPRPPADLTAEHFWAHSDGDLFWYLSHGIENPHGGLAMPGFDRVLSSEARWDLIDYLRAQSAGASMRTLGKWLHPLAVPQFDAVCPDGRNIDLDDLRGRVLRITAISSEDQIPENTAGWHRSHHYPPCQEWRREAEPGSLRCARSGGMGGLRRPGRRVAG